MKAVLAPALVSEMDVLWAGASASGLVQPENDSALATRLGAGFRVGGQDRGGGAGRAGERVGDRRQRAFLEVQDRVAERLFGEFVEDRRELPGGFVGEHFSLQAHRDAVPGGLRVEVHRVGRSGDRAGFRPAKVEAAFQRPGRERRHFQADGPDFGAGGAFDARFRAVDARLRGRARRQSGGGRGVQRHAFGQRHGDALDLASCRFRSVASWLTETSVAKPSGWSWTSVAGVTEKPGSKGTAPQFSRWVVSACTAWVPRRGPLLRLRASGWWWSCLGSWSRW